MGLGVDVRVQYGRGCEESVGCLNLSAKRKSKTETSSDIQTCIDSALLLEC